jgi:acetolactate decarboxylase
MVILNGQFFQARCDGSVREVEDNAVTPFAAVTPFSPDISVMMGSCLGMQCVTAVFDELRKSDNIFFALRVDGKFESVRARAMCRSDEGVRLVQAAAVQPEFEFCDIAGTLVGFWSPEYASAFNVPGYHFHFISADRTCGGHVLECRGRDLRLQIQREGEYHVALPETEAFLRADLTRDPKADIKRAEGAK